jgi:type VI secretion system secreted protein Hcp
MAVDIFLKLDGIKGESQDKTHKNEIDVLSWSWSMSQSGTTHMGTGGGGGKVAVGDLHFTHYLDNASPTLMKFCCNGKHISKGTLVVRKAGEKPLEYVKIDFEEIIVTSISHGGHGSEDRHIENVTLNFGKFKKTYTVQTDTGTAGASPDVTWDIAQNSE